MTTKTIAVATHDGLQVAGNTEKLIERARKAGLRDSQFEVRRADDTPPFSNYDHRMTLYVTPKGKEQWDKTNSD